MPIITGYTILLLMPCTAGEATMLVQQACGMCGMECPNNVNITNTAHTPQQHFGKQGPLCRIGDCLYC